ncbi:MAG: zinc ribbon domain-containing protein [Asgard group archaeon]|nr:zinc ribbon domain-containing protein [Asgard group archaeon]
MDKKYCVSCGTAVTSTDGFCFKCGAKIENYKKLDEPSGSVRIIAERPNNLDDQDYIKTRKPQSKRRYKPLLVILLIVGALVPIAVMSSIASIRTPIGTLTYDVPTTGTTDVDLIIDNSVGSINIIYDDSITNLFEAFIEVRGGFRATMDDAINFEHEVVGDEIIISFIDDQSFKGFFNMKSLSYKIDIWINPIAIVDFNIEISTGSITCSLDGNDDLLIKDAYFSSSTGSVNFISGTVENTTIGDIYIESSTGSLLFDFRYSTDASITDLIMDTSTGSVKAYLGETMIINCTDVTLSTSTGSVLLEYTNIIQLGDLDWNLDTSTGSITLNFEQTILPAVNCSSTYYLETSTGSINVNCETDVGIGIEMSADTSTGSITLPSGGSYYSSPDFSLKSSQYSFILLTSTGSITASVYN